MTSETESREASDCFQLLVTRFLSQPNVTTGTGFGSTPGLRVGGKIFVMVMKDELVVKLSKARVDQLVASRTGRPFVSGHGRPMKEWVSVPMLQCADWERLAVEALAFVAGVS